MANSADDLPQKIVDTALGPARVSAGGTTVDAQDLSKLIEAEKHLAGKTAAARNHLGLRFIQLIPPGGG